MKLKGLKNRLRRNQLPDLAGEFYCSEDSKIIRQLKRENKNVYIGISNGEGTYTILGDKNTYYKFGNLLEERKIPNTELLRILKKNVMSIGKDNEYKLININNSEFLWVMNSAVMCAIWNTLIFIESNGG